MKFHLILKGEGAALGLGLPCYSLSQGLMSLEVSLSVQAQLGVGKSDQRLL